MHSYQIGELAFTQEELSAMQTIKLTRLMKGRASLLQGRRTLQDAMDSIAEDPELLLQFLQLVLRGPVEKLSLETLPGSVLARVVADFFGCNAQLGSELLRLLNTLGSMLASAKEPAKEQPSS